MRRLAEEAGVEFRLGSQFEVTRIRWALQAREYWLAMPFLSLLMRLL